MCVLHVIVLAKLVQGAYKINVSTVQIPQYNIIKT